MAPTDMAMNLMEVVRTYELAPSGRIGISCQIPLSEVLHELEIELALEA